MTILLLASFLGLEVPLSELAAVPAYAMSWIALHEGSHALAAKADGRDIQSFRPYPHREDGRVLFGSVRYSGSYSAPVMLAPYAVDLVAFAAADASAGAANRTLAAQAPLLTIMACATIDLGLGIESSAMGRGDLSAMRGRNVALGIGTAALLVMGYRLYSRLSETVGGRP